MGRRLTASCSQNPIYHWHLRDNRGFVYYHQRYQEIISARSSEPDPTRLDAFMHEVAPVLHQGFTRDMSEALAHVISWRMPITRAGLGGEKRGNLETTTYLRQLSSPR
jgi:hypothetical protein